MTTSLFNTLLNLFKSAGAVFSFSASILSISAFKQAKLDFAAYLSNADLQNATGVDTSGIKPCDSF